jgi:hypothetical protein
VLHVILLYACFYTLYFISVAQLSLPILTSHWNAGAVSSVVSAGAVSSVVSAGVVYVVFRQLEVELAAVITEMLNTP